MVSDELGLTCIIALDDVVDIVPSQVVRSLGFVAPRSSVDVRLSPVQGPEQSLIVQVDQCTFACAVFEGRIPEPEYSFSLHKSVFWPDATESMAHHCAFVVISGADQETRHGLVRAQAVALTRLTATLAEILPSCGILWNGSLICTSPQRLASAPTEISNGKWPVDVWVGYQFFGQEDVEKPFLGLQTRGASDYLGFEMEVPPFFVSDRKEPVRILYNAVGYLMNYGDVIKDGQLVEVEGERRTQYQLHLGVNGEPGLARLTVLPTDHRELN